MKEKKVGRPEQRFKIHTTFDNAIDILMSKKTDKKENKTNNSKKS